jgi:hypothetical protein
VPSFKLVSSRGAKDVKKEIESPSIHEFSEHFEPSEGSAAARNFVGCEIPPNFDTLLDSKRLTN